ncbi:translation elongation factor Ts [Gelria sp. Kuro-4]|uniref:translation elongation factor Ts n=1 Tax=Gelria sp. Kuro-4 TaxID=2796927 RepID=UPI001BEDB201|nr:translation elongation factor Ts [Gelria sp. Kuro-4]BCV24955.1 elongation factor Ts [Gelria sp. Kuro-4]
MAITAEMVKALREKTGAGMMDCKRALQETGGDMDKATEYLREKGLAAAAKRAGRTAAEGLVDAYIHLGGKLGVLVEVNCETDFVARTPEFREFVRDIAMQVAAANPQYLAKEDVPAAVLDKEREILRVQALNEGKPEKVVDRIVEGRLEKFYSENCLLEQPFIKDPDKKVHELLTEKIARIGENIVIRRFVRFQLGETQA